MNLEKILITFVLLAIFGIILWKWAKLCEQDLNEVEDAKKITKGN